MLLRHQVLLTDWQTEHLKKMANRSDVSFSEIIRILICEGIIRAGMTIVPEYNEKIDKKKINNLTSEGTKANTDIATRHKIISELYFEARKLADYIDIKVEKEEKKILNTKKKS